MGSGAGERWSRLRRRVLRLLLPQEFGVELIDHAPQFPTDTGAFVFVEVGERDTGRRLLSAEATPG
jgi:hypothetical protein